MEITGRRISYVFLCALPFLNLVVVGARGLRIPGLSSGVGILLFAAILLSAWTLGLRGGTASKLQMPMTAAAAALLIAPWGIISLLWVGLGAPFQATTAENYMRYLVLLWSSLVVASGFIVLKQVLYDSGERFYSTLGLAASIPAGAAYAISVSISLAQTMAKLNGSDATASPLLVNLYSVLEFVAVILTYLATAAFAASLGQAGWLGRRAAYGYVMVIAVFVSLLIARGLSYPQLSGTTAPWYTQPGFIVGIPAVPWIMPGLLGVVLLRVAGDRKLHEPLGHPSTGWPAPKND